MVVHFINPSTELPRSTSNTIWIHPESEAPRGCTELPRAKAQVPLELGGFLPAGVSCGIGPQLDRVYICTRRYLTTLLTLVPIKVHLRK